MVFKGHLDDRWDLVLTTEVSRAKTDHKICNLNFQEAIEGISQDQDRRGKNREKIVNCFLDI